jgi:hypothetical protein
MVLLMSNFVLDLMPLWLNNLLQELLDLNFKVNFFFCKNRWGSGIWKPFPSEGLKKLLAWVTCITDQIERPPLSR